MAQKAKHPPFRRFGLRRDYIWNVRKELVREVERTCKDDPDGAVEQYAFALDTLKRYAEAYTDASLRHQIEQIYDRLEIISGLYPSRAAPFYSLHWRAYDMVRQTWIPHAKPLPWDDLRLLHRDHYALYRERGQERHDFAVHKAWIRPSLDAKAECARCGRDGRLEIDHIVPLQLGGANYGGNFQILCCDCNDWKRKKIWSSAFGEVPAVPRAANGVGWAF